MCNKKVMNTEYCRNQYVLQIHLWKRTKIIPFFIFHTELALWSWSLVLLSSRLSRWLLGLRLVDPLAVTPLARLQVAELRVPLIPPHLFAPLVLVQPHPTHSLFLSLCPARSHHLDFVYVSPKCAQVGQQSVNLWLVVVVVVVCFSFFPQETTIKI